MPTLIIKIKMKRIIQLFLLSIVSLYFVSCETDFNVIADYKEVAIVYGLLNQSDTVHYLRINKAFLGSGNALTYASIPDSSTFGSNIKVMLISDTKDTLMFDTLTLFNKQPGDFYSPGQLFYASKEVLNENNTYKLLIINKKTGNEVSSVTNLIHNFHFTKPDAGLNSINFRRSITSGQKIRWENAVNGKRYQLKIFFNYKELNSVGDTTFKRTEWVFPEQTSKDITGLDEIEVAYLNENFFTLCTNNIPYVDQPTENAVVKRIASSCDLEVTVVGDEFNTYLDANGPSTGLLIEKPSYSNIVNGLGLFSSRYQIHRSIPLGAETILDLSTTTSLKFVKPN